MQSFWNAFNQSFFPENDNQSKKETFIYFAFESLPQDLIVQGIFQYLNYHDLQQVSLVNKFFKAMYDQEILWKLLIQRDYHTKNISSNYKKEYQKLCSKSIGSKSAFFAPNQSNSAVLVNWASSLFSKKKKTVPLIGLDSAGKTTLIYTLTRGQTYQIPTLSLWGAERALWKNIELECFDIGQEKMRPLFRHYFEKADALIFVIDSNAIEKFPQVKDELQWILAEPSLQKVDILFFANKQDLPKALSPIQIAEKLELCKITQTWLLHALCLYSHEGLKEGLEWLSKRLDFSRNDKV